MESHRDEEKVGSRWMPLGDLAEWEGKVGGGIIFLLGDARKEIYSSILLLHRRMKDFAPALKHIADIIERGIREHPELSVGMQTEGIEVREWGRAQSESTNNIFTYCNNSISTKPVA